MEVGDMIIVNGKSQRSHLKRSNTIIEGGKSKERMEMLQDELPYISDNYSLSK